MKKELVLLQYFSRLFHLVQGSVMQVQRLLFCQSKPKVDKELYPLLSKPIAFLPLSLPSSLLSSLTGLPDGVCLVTHISIYFTFLNSYILFNIDPIDTKLESVPNLKVLFLTMRLSCCLSYNKRTRTQPCSKLPCLKLGKGTPLYRYGSDVE